MSTRDKIEFATLMGRHSSASPRDVLALLRFAGSYALAQDGRKAKIRERIESLCDTFDGAAAFKDGQVFVVTTGLDIRIPV